MDNSTAIYYGIPNTDEWIITEKQDSSLEARGYVKLLTGPPKLTPIAKVNGKKYVISDFGSWVLKDDPKYIDNVTKFFQLVFKVKPNPKLLRTLADKLEQQQNVN